MQFPFEKKKNVKIQYSLSPFLSTNRSQNLVSILFTVIIWALLFCFVLFVPLDMNTKDQRKFSPIKVNLISDESFYDLQSKAFSSDLLKSKTSAVFDEDVYQNIEEISDSSLNEDVDIDIGDESFLVLEEQNNLTAEADMEMDAEFIEEKRRNDAFEKEILQKEKLEEEKRNEEIKKEALRKEKLEEENRKKELQTEIAKREKLEEEKKNEEIKREALRKEKLEEEKRTKELQAEIAKREKLEEEKKNEEIKREALRKEKLEEEKRKEKLQQEALQRELLAKNDSRLNNDAKNIKNSLENTTKKENNSNVLNSESPSEDLKKNQNDKTEKGEKNTISKNNFAESTTFSSNSNRPTEQKASSALYQEGKVSTFSGNVEKKKDEYQITTKTAKNEVVFSYKYESASKNFECITSVSIPSSLDSKYVFVKLVNGAIRRLLDPNSLALKISPRYESLVVKNISMSIRFIIKPDGTVPFESISIPSGLPLEIQNDIRNQMVYWRFDKAQSDGQATISYSIKMK